MGTGLTTLISLARLIVPALALVSVVLAGGALAAGASRSGGSRVPMKRYHLTARYPENPAVYGSTLVWRSSQSRYGFEDLNESLVSPFRPKVIARDKPSGPNEKFVEPVVSANWIAWADGYYAWQLWAMNRKTGKTILVDSSKKSGFPPFVTTIVGFAIYGNTIVWTPTTTCLKGSCAGPGPPRHWTSYVREENLPTGKVVNLYSTQAPCHQNWPSVSSNLIVWMQEGLCPSKLRGGPSAYKISGTDLLMLNRDSGKITQLTSNHISAVPTTNGRYVAWKQAANRFAGGAIILMNLSTHKQTLVSQRTKKDPQDDCQAKSGAPWTQCDTEPELLQNSLVWYANDGHVDEAFGLESRKRYVLDVGTKTYSQYWAQGSQGGDYAAWGCATINPNPPPGPWDGITKYMCIAKVPG